MEMNYYRENNIDKLQSLLKELLINMTIREYRLTFQLVDFVFTDFSIGEKYREELRLRIYSNLYIETPEKRRLLKDASVAENRTSTVHLLDQVVKDVTLDSSGQLELEFLDLNRLIIPVDPETLPLEESWILWDEGDLSTAFGTLETWWIGCDVRGVCGNLYAE